MILHPFNIGTDSTPLNFAMHNCKYTYDTVIAIYFSDEFGKEMSSIYFNYVLCDNDSVTLTLADSHPSTVTDVFGLTTVEFPGDSDRELHILTPVSAA